MDTKQKGDIAEHAVALYALKQGWGVLQPIGDRLPYDLVLDVDGTLIRVQVKSAWRNAKSGNHVVDNRRTKTNRRVMKRSAYRKEDFDFAVAFLEDSEIFYIFPVEVFIGYKSEIHMVESSKRQRKPKSAPYRNAWALILQRAARSESHA